MPAKIKHQLIIIVIIVVNLMVYKTAFADIYDAPELSSEAAVLMDAQTGQVLYAKNMFEQYYPASITKIMTGMLALEKGNLQDKIVMSNEAVFSIGRGSSHIALDVDEKITLEQALYALSISSANDAANGIAEHIAGDLAGFAELMNQKAKDLGAVNTHFANAHGLHESNHYTTAYDMAKILREAIKNPQFLTIFSEKRFEIPPTNIQPETRYLNSTNSFINGEIQGMGVIASKSGWTPEARHTLATAAQKGERKLIVVVLNSPTTETKYADTVKLLEYGFNAFKTISFDASHLVEGHEELELEEMEGLEFNPVKIERLAHQSLTISDIATSLKLLLSNSNQTVVEITFNLKEMNNLMHHELGQANLTITAENPNDKFLYSAIAVPIVFLLLLVLLIRRSRKRRQTRYIYGNNNYRRFKY
ncbi:MAG: D-alanyl-D-alanine carboxypeptidase [Firmicutes bacterium]|nr:D-alanyl-D-alanine carboxypeptidase [Bacillota bacterium]